MEHAPGLGLAGRALNAIAQVEQTLRNTVEGVIRSDIAINGGNPEEWWAGSIYKSELHRYVTYIHLSTRQIVEDYKADLEQNSPEQRHPIIYATLGNLIYIVEHLGTELPWHIFRDQLVGGTRRIYNLIADLHTLNSVYRPKLTHQQRYQENISLTYTLQDLKHIFQITLNIISIIPSEYHDDANLYGAGNLSECINEALKLAYEEEEKNRIQDRGRISHLSGIARREIREGMILASAFNAGKEYNHERWIGLSLAAHSREEVNRLRHAFMAGAGLQDAPLEPNAVAAFTNVIIQLLSWRAKEAKKAHQTAKEEFGTTYENEIIEAIKAFRDDQDNDITELKYYSDFLRSITH